MKYFFIHGIAGSGKTTLCNVIDTLYGKKNLVVRDLDEYMKPSNSELQYLDLDIIKKMLQENKNKNVIFCGVEFSNIEDLYMIIGEENIKRYYLNSDNFSIIGCTFRYQVNHYLLLLLNSPLTYFYHFYQLCKQTEKCIRDKDARILILELHNIDIKELLTESGFQKAEKFEEIIEDIVSDLQLDTPQNSKKKLQNIIKKNRNKNILTLICFILLRIILLLSIHMIFILNKQKNLNLFLISCFIGNPIIDGTFIILSLHIYFFNINIYKCVQLTYTILSDKKFTNTKIKKEFDFLFKKKLKKMKLLNKKEMNEFKKKNNNKNILFLNITLKEYLKKINNNEFKDVLLYFKLLQFNF
jgi:hypothetical protein